MLRTYSEVLEDATDVIRRYVAWKRNEVESVLNRSNGDLPSRHELATIAEEAGKYATRARKVLRHVDAATLPDDDRADLEAIIEEMDLAAAEGAAAADPDNVWAEMSGEQKRHITERVPIERGKADRLRARIRGDLRRSTPPPHPEPNANAGGPK